ncbi:MAG: DUF4340 domain-containing protein [Candidatus Omnitrophica bacterium]|nr:DUF4340 domain-containing protein [Candidatus Omnitrophota bacterium]
MNKKSLIILCVIFAVLMGLVFVKRSVKPTAPTKEEIVDIITPAVGINNLSEIVLRLGDGSTEDVEKPKNIHLAKEGGQWLVKTQYGVFADDKTITPLLDKLDRLKGELRSDRKGLLGDYGIGDDEGVHVELRQDGAKDIHVIVGVKNAGYQNNFVRLEGSNAVYVVNENLLGAIGVRGEEEDQKLDAQKWTDKRIAHLTAEDVVGIAITENVNGAEETVVDIRKNTIDDKKQWQSVEPYAFTLSASKIKSMIDKFNSAYARDVIAPDAEGVFDTPAWTGVFTMENGDQFTLVRGAKDTEGNNYYVKQEGAGYFYLVPLSTFDGREKQQGDIFADNPLKAGEGNVTAIEIYDIKSKKKFNVTKKPSQKTPEGEGTAGQEGKEEYVWQASNGETIEKEKVKGIIDKLTSINVEAIPRSITSKGMLTLKITNDEGTKDYTVSESITLDNTKECHVLALSGNDLKYCVSKEHVKALIDALP